MSKVVLDTNVVVAAFATRGLCESVFELCLEGHDLIISNFLLNELKEKLIHKLKLSEKHTEEILKLYTKSSRPVEPSVNLGEISCRDPEDIPVLGTCVSGKADFLVSGDKDLLILDKIKHCRIVNPREFYELQR